MRARRIFWAAAVLAVALVASLVLVRAVAGGSRIGESTAGELRNLEGNPLPSGDPVSLRMAVVDAAFGRVGPDGEVDPWKAYLAGRALGRAIALAEPDLIVIFDIRLDAPEGEIPVHLRAAVEAERPWWATLVTVDRATPRWAGFFGIASLAPMLAGNVVLADGPVEVDTALLRRGAAGPQAAADVATARPSEWSLSIAVGPATELGLVVKDGEAAEPAPSGVFVVQRGGAGGIRSEDGNIAIHVAEGWSVTQSVTTLHWEQAGARGVLLDMTRTR